MKRAFFLLAILFVVNIANANWRWTKKADFAGVGRTDANGFSINGKGYIGNGHDGTTFRKDWYCYDPATNSWSKIADFAGSARMESVAFVIAGKAYLGTGSNGSNFSDFYEYDPLANQWTKKADFPGTARRGAFGFAIGNKGYIGSGCTDGSVTASFNDFYEYNPSSDSWTKKADFAGAGRAWSASFAINNKGYVACGASTNLIRKSDFWQYDTSSNSWTQKASWGGGVASSCVGFGIAGKGYLGSGYDGANNLKVFYEYDTLKNSWKKGTDYAGTSNRSSVAFVIAGSAYIGTGNPGYQKVFYEFKPNNKPTDIILSVASIDENSPINSIIDTLKTVDQDISDVFSYSFVTGVGSTDNSKFTLTNGVLKTNQVFDYEMQNSYSIRIVTNDGLDTFQKQFIIRINNLFEFAPSDISLLDSTIDENKPKKTFIGKFTTTDADIGDSFTYKLVSGVGSDHNSNFLIIGDSLKSNKVFDFETDSFYTIRVRSTDLQGLFVEKLLLVYINDISGASILSYQMANSFSVYPNPVSEVINIESDKRLGKSTIELRDVSGKMIYFEEVSISSTNFKAQIKTNKLNPGIYFLSVRSGKTYSSFRIVVK